MQLPHNDSPLARWRINLRECLSYTILVTCPEQIYSLNEKLTDAQCVEVLESVQSRHHLVEGTIPASVFTVAISHYTTLALDEGMKASESIEEGTTALNHLHDDVDKWGLRPRLLSADLIRKRIVILLTDSGAIIYRMKSGDEFFLVLTSAPTRVSPILGISCSCRARAVQIGRSGQPRCVTSSPHTVTSWRSAATANRGFLATSPSLSSTI